MASARFTVRQHVETAAVGAFMGAVGVVIGWPVSAIGGLMVASGVRGALAARKNADGRSPK